MGEEEDLQKVTGMDGDKGTRQERWKETKRRNGHIEFKTREMQIGKEKQKRPTKTDRLAKEDRNEETDGGDKIQLHYLVKMTESRGHREPGRHGQPWRQR